MVEIWFSILVCKAMEKSIAHFLFWGNPPQKVGRTMSEALICRRGYNAEGRPPEYHVETIASNGNFIVPQNVYGNISVRIFGGGGGGDIYRGGCGGFMNNSDLNIPGGTSVPITIGAGGAADRSGGLTSFGIYLSANGGHAGSTGERSGGSLGGSCLGTASQFGGGGGSGSGGIWGGGGACSGNGGMYGGGGGGEGGDGVGAGGGGSSGGSGGTYGGDGGYGSYFLGLGNNHHTDGSPGINTIGNVAVPSDCQGAGLGGKTLNYSSGYRISIGGGGGGGFGGNGGSVINGFLSGDGTIYNTIFVAGVGGGGGYGSNGGNGYNGGYGGGGGYGRGADGGAGIGQGACGGGGGYFAPGGDGNRNSGFKSGGGGGYGRGAQYGTTASFGGGGTSYGASYNRGHAWVSGGSGICIIEYYTS